MSTTTELLKKVSPAKTRASALEKTAKADTLMGVVCKPEFQAQMALALPKSLTAERLTRIVATECKKTPELLKCNPESFFGAVLQCAQLGLEPGSALGHCYLLPFGNGKDKSGRPNCQLIIGYRGMLDIARRSGQILSINAYCVYQNDEFDYELGLHPDIKHRPSAMANRGPVTYVYAVAQLKDGGIQFEVMSRAEIEAVRNASQGYQAYEKKRIKTTPWVSDFDAMAKKTVIRRLFKYLPVSIEALNAVAVDEKSDRGEAMTEQDFINGMFTDKGIVVQPVTPPIGQDTPPTPIDQGTSSAAPAVAPEPAPEIPDDIPPELDEWRNAYDQGQHI